MVVAIGVVVAALTVTDTGTTFFSTTGSTVLTGTSDFIAAGFVEVEK